LGGADAARDVSLGGAQISSDAPLGGAPGRSVSERATDDSFPAGPSGPLSRRSVVAERARQAAQRNVMLRPLRLLVVGKEAPYTPEDQAFLHFVRTSNIPLVFNKPIPSVRALRLIDATPSTCIPRLLFKRWSWGLLGTILSGTIVVVLFLVRSMSRNYRAMSSMLWT